MMAIAILVALAWLPRIGYTQAARPDSAWDETAVRATVEDVAAIIQREYMDAEMAVRAADDLRRRLASSEYAATSTPDELARRLTRDLFAVTNDKHIAVALVHPAS